MGEDVMELMAWPGGIEMSIAAAPEKETTR
jgi:hypothetical protein